MESQVTVSYQQFGAVADGKTNDIAAIIKTHAYANENGLKVVADKGAKYYIGYTEESAIIQTDVDFGDAEFIIDLGSIFAVTAISIPSNNPIPPIVIAANITVEYSIINSFIIILRQHNPAKPINAIARMPAVMRAMDIP